ncbi:hypothetical protein KFE25_008955 [Diacronema lutheri]|uniref:N-acetylgalactosaminide beta-1,3-galactosyltransferase n=3 Tax=Diacronema lutheri TaxID=2081491 RepID=A0A8J5XTZ3_DIALT|nr:hypothetical protein KFE25_008955 [Diacronema lutheri]
MALLGAALMTLRPVVEVDLRSLVDRSNLTSSATDAEDIASDEASDEVFTAHMQLTRAEFDATLPQSNGSVPSEHLAANRSARKGHVRRAAAKGWPSGRHAPQPRSAPDALRPSHIQFVVMASKQLRHKAHLAYHTWCAIRGVRCLFIVDTYFGDGRGRHMMPMFRVPAARTIDPSRCCRGGHGFFCRKHRQDTLAAQYRFLPALQHVKSLAHVQAGDVRWVIIVDDDSFVFVGNLLRLLRTLDPRRPLYFGDVHPGRPIVCGGGGSVFSIGAIQKMDVDRCIWAMHRVCMQSDWMLGECAHRAGVQMLTDYGCHTCAAGARRWYRTVEAALPRCFFMQEVDPFLERLPLDTPTPAIIHGIAPDQLDNTFRRLMNASVAGVF